MAGWRSWGALPDIFTDDTAASRELRELLSDAEWASARRTTINAHYTDPNIVDAIWDAVRGLGFDGGRVLEPGCGSGLFIGCAPSGLPMRFTGVELDPISAEIAQHLHAAAEIRAESYVDTRYPSDTFDLTIGNVPFADVRPYDPRHNAGNHSLHNYFILKSLDLTRPGGLVAVLTSRYTMDATNTVARASMHETADLVGAVRLPSDAHRAFAGTDAVTDLVILRKRLPGEQPGDDSWLISKPDDSALQGISLNRWWCKHPELVIGELGIGHGPYGASLVVAPTPGRDSSAEQVADDLRAATSHVAASTHLRFLPRTTPQEVHEPLVEPVARIGDAVRFEGHLTRHTSGKWTQLAGGIQQPFTVPNELDRELNALVGLRNRVIGVLTRESASRDDTPDLVAARAGLRTAYEAYVRAFGPINRVKVTSTNRLDKSGEPVVVRRYPPAVRLFRQDPHAAPVLALERYDESTGIADTAAILHQRVIAPRTPRERASTPADALAICLDTTGRVDLPTIARLLDVDDATARTQLGTLVFDDPIDRSLVPAPEYLSGNVRAALTVAQKAAAEDPAYLVNVDALRLVIPADLAPEQITATLGAVWIPARDVRNFLQVTLDDRVVDVEHLGGSNWKVRGGHRRSTAATVTWGTDRLTAYEIAERLMRQERIVVNDAIEDANGRQTTVVNSVATEAAQAKAQELQERFGQWVWAEPTRAERLARVYNDTFNSIVLRSYDAEGDRLSLPGLAASFAPHRHQRAAVARIIAEPSVGLFHAVGAGKTAEMVMGATELRRLGLVSKPAVVVPNHMLEQVTREWLQLYPAANLLAASSDDLTKDRRRAFVARVATGDWDAVVMTQSAFGSIPVSIEGQRRYLDAQIDTRRTHLERARDAGVSYQSVKQLEKAILREEQRLARLLDRKVDPGITWEQTGIDYLLVDELHMYKNLAITSSIEGVAREPAARATDLDMKITLLREAAGPRGRVITGATATPIANTMAEAYVMQHYLRPDLLTAAGLTDFDAWAGTFGRTVSKLEMKPAGDGFRMKDRFASFQNLPELLQMWHVPADVKTAADLGLPVPLIAPDAAGRRTPEIVVVPLSEGQEAFMRTLADRAERIRSRAVPPSEDNMAVVSTDGRKAGLDLRLLASPPAGAAEGLFPEPTKVDVAAARIHRIWAEHRDDLIPGSARPGGLQIVFCDFGTPTAERWNMYDGLRDALTSYGMDPSRIRFVHDANTEAKKARLFAQCRDGEVDVVIGSTLKMGVGTNIQTRAVALHHLDCPWRPADLEQREGRIVRQGNRYPEVQILRYVTQGSFDGYMWQGVARKASFIDQVMHARLDQRVAEDIDDDGEQFDYATVTAVASGNPLLLERATVQAEVDKLLRLEAAHGRAQRGLGASIHELDRTIGGLRELEPRLAAAAASRVDTAGDAFRMAVGGVWFTDRVEAADAVRAALVSGQLSAASTGGRGLVELGGHGIEVTTAWSGAGRLVVAGVDGVADHVRFQAAADSVANGHGLVTRLENLVAGLDGQHAAVQQRLAQAVRDRDEAHRTHGTPFPQRAELTAALDRLTDLDSRLGSSERGPRDKGGSALPCANGSPPLRQLTVRLPPSSHAARGAAAVWR